MENTKEPKAKKAKKVNTDLSDMSVHALKIELQKTLLNIRTGNESNKSLAKNLRKAIARKLTEQNKVQ